MRGAGSIGAETGGSMAAKIQIASNDDDLSDGVRPLRRGLDGHARDAGFAAPMVQRAMAGEACLGCPAVE